MTCATRGAIIDNMSNQTSSIMDFLIPLGTRNDKTPHLSDRKRVGSDLMRFAQIRAFEGGFHPRLSKGQVWESMDPTTSDKFGFRQVIIDNVQDDGYCSVSVVNFNGKASHQGLGDVLKLASLDFGRTGVNEGWKLRAVTVPLDTLGAPIPGYSLPPKPKMPVVPTVTTTPTVKGTSKKGIAASKKTTSSHWKNSQINHCIRHGRTQEQIDTKRPLSSVWV